MFGRRVLFLFRCMGCYIMCTCAISLHFKDEMCVGVEIINTNKYEIILPHERSMIYEEFSELCFRTT